MCLTFQVDNIRAIAPSGKMTLLVAYVNMNCTKLLDMLLKDILGKDFKAIAEHFLKKCLVLRRKFFLGKAYF